MGLSEYNEKVKEEMTELVKTKGINSFKSKFSKIKKVFMAYKGALM
jgi:hypothetical protein